MKANQTLRIGVIGCGHWGRNQIRAFSQTDRVAVQAAADLDRVRLAEIGLRYPFLRLETDHRRVLDDPYIDAVVVATPTCTHGAIAAEALAAGKHVLVEKPLCLTTAQAEILAEAAAKAGRVLMVGHTFLFNAGVRKLHDVIERGELGRIHYIDAARTDLGPIRNDLNALYDLGTHDISVCNYLLGQTPVAVSALGSAITQPSMHDVAFITLQYPGGTFAHLHVSWLNPRKARTMTAVGGLRTAHFDDFDPRESLRIFERQAPAGDTLASAASTRVGASIGGSAGAGSAIDGASGIAPKLAGSATLAAGVRRAAETRSHVGPTVLREVPLEVRSPAIERPEPLLLQAAAFTRWVLDGAKCPCGIGEASAVVAALEAANRSMQLEGALCWIGGESGDLILKEAEAEAASVPQIAVPAASGFTTAEMERVRRRCGIPAAARS